MAEDTSKLLQSCGIVDREIKFQGRKLSFYDQASGLNFLLVRSQDVPTYVESGVADVGIVGKDVLVEQGKRIYELLDLRFGYCRISLAGPTTEQEAPENIRVATKYPRTTESFFAGKGQDAEIIKLYGSIELAPLTGLSHYIVDLVSSGQTLKENNLVELETILESTGRLIANRASYSLKNERIAQILKSMKKFLHSQA
jgi:ATP phosphoribosyltransferase